MKTLLSHSRFTFFLFVLLCSVSVNSQAETARDAVTRLQNKYDTIKSLSLDFVQNTRGQLTGRPKIGRGRAYFVKNSKPGKMRWNYSDPDRQVLVSDGTTFSMYFESLQQMIVTPATALDKDLTYSFFTGSGNLLTDFDISEGEHKVDNSAEQTVVIKLTPKVSQTQVASIQLWITDDSLIRRIEILDLFDTITVLNFSNLQVNAMDLSDTSMLEKLFSFTPPEDTEIIQQ
jgi:outer membrane lipoprotein carrier protein